MTDQELERRLDEIERLARRARIERPGLYLMVVLLLMKGCSIETNVDNVNSKLTGLAGDGPKITITNK